MNFLSRLLVFPVIMIPMIIMEAAAQSKKEIIYIGTYTDSGSQGIYVLQFDRQEGTLAPIQTIKEFANPSFLALHPSGNFLYAVHEAASEQDEDSGTVSAYAIDKGSGKLTFLNSQLSKGGAPCHISIDRTGKLAFVSNYTGGSVVVLPLMENGHLAPASDIQQHQGSSINPERQESPHVHSALLTPGNKSVIVSDLGTDMVHNYRISFQEKKLIPAPLPFIEVTPGTGPRHFIFHPDGKFAFLAQELSSSVAVFSYDPTSECLQLIADQISTLPEGFAGENSVADIHTNPTGKYLYVSNRGHNSLAVFAIKQDGGLDPLGHHNVKGQTPRNFLVDPKGTFVFVANQDSNNIVLFKLDPLSGKLLDTNHEVSIPKPVCIQILQL